MRNAKWIATAVGIAASMVALPSFADAPPTSDTIQIGVGFRYGQELNDGDLNPWGNGVGLEIGYTLPILHFYVGGQAEYFFGGSSELGDFKVDSNLWQVTAEGGYDFGVGKHLVIRPKLGLGYANVLGKTCVAGLNCGKDNSSQAVLAPGVKFIIVAGHFQVAFDARYEVLTSDPVSKGAIFSLGVGF